MVGRTTLPIAGRIAAAVAASALLLALTPAAGSAATTGGAGGGKQSTCPALPGTLAGTGGPAGFTMLIRINNQTNVNVYTRPVAEDGLKEHIRPQDIFVINTRFQNGGGTSNPTVSDQLAVQLRAAFPCNRIIALNGLSPDSTTPGYVYALTGSSAGIFSVMLDWEPLDWGEAIAEGAALPPFTYKPRPTLKRVGSWITGLSTTLSLGPNPYARAGLAPLDLPQWNFGQIAQTMDIPNARLGGRHLSTQSVQTQESCMKGGSVFGARVKQVMDQYRFRIKIKKKKVRKGRKIVTKKIRKRVKIKKKARPNLNNLAMQVSFSDTPNPADPLPVRNVAPATADSCVLNGLARGAGAFFFFASDDAMRLLFAQPTMASLRPAS